MSVTEERKALLLRRGDRLEVETWLDKKGRLMHLARFTRNGWDVSIKTGQHHREAEMLCELEERLKGMRR